VQRGGASRLRGGGSAEDAGDVVTEALVLDCGIITVSDGPASDSPSIPMQ
jgi:hypothetical protein